MAYYGYEFYYDGTRANFWAYLQVALVNMGWELHDDISATAKVYKSNGESGNEPYGYIWIDAGTSTYMEFRAYQHWDAVSHVGIRLRRTADSTTTTRLSLSYWTATIPALIAGDKDMVIVSHYEKQLGGQINYIIFGHVPHRSGMVVGAHGTAGTAGTLTVASTSGLGVGMRIQIVGTNGYIDNGFIQGVPNASTIIINSLAVDYGTGSKIGTPASTFGITTGYNYYGTWYPVSVWGDTGTAGTSTLSYSATYLGQPQLGMTLYFNEKKYVLSPIFITSVSALVPGALIGMLSDNYGVVSSVADWDAVAANNDGSFATAGTGSFGTATSSGASSLIDSSKAWGVDELIGKFCIMTGGSGTAAGGIKKIAGNDSTSFTVDSNWFIQPVSGSIYILVDLARRNCRSLIGYNSYNAVLLTDTTPPA